jgi:hypothetical protein
MFNAVQIRERIAGAAMAEAELPLAVANEVAFHMTDWLNDLAAFVEFCQSPESYEPKRVNELLLAFLLHAPNHIAAAAKLYAESPVSDVFGVGAVDPSADAGA